jgi:hypothetical protein
MDYNELQNVIEDKRKELIDLIVSINFTTSEAVGFAIQEHYLGITLKNDYSDDNEFEDNFKKVYLRRNNNVGAKELIFSKTMTDVLEHLYSKQIGKTYIEIKKYVYARLEEEKTLGNYWGSDNFDFGDDFKEWLWFMEDKLYTEVDESVANDEWNIIPAKKGKNNKIKEVK